LVAHHVKLFIEVATHAGWAVWIVVGHTSSFFVSTMLMIGVPRQASITLFGGFAISSDTIMTDMKDLAPESQRKRGQLETVSMEPSEYVPGLSSKMSLIESPRIWWIATMFTTGAG
jgi:hypothetical protein